MNPTKKEQNCPCNEMRNPHARIGVFKDMYLVLKNCNRDDKKNYKHGAIVKKVFDIVKRHAA